MSHEWVLRTGDDQENVQDWEHPLVQAVVNNPDDPPSLEVFYGFLGRSPFVGHRRIYVDPGFTRYFDILEYMIVYTMRLDGSHTQRVTQSALWDSAPDWGSAK